jgi:octaprenyl-diphosphate synthase
MWRFWVSYLFIFAGFMPKAPFPLPTFFDPFPIRRVSAKAGSFFLTGRTFSDKKQRKFKEGTREIEGKSMPVSERINQQIQPDLEKIEYFLRENLSSSIPLISEINRHILLGGGKRLRALLFVLCARLCGYREGKEHYYSCIFEYLHAASLLHDDVIDNAALRRGKPSANTLWGNSASILVGDFLLAKTFALSLATGLLDFLQVISKTSTLMSEGMVQELIETGNLDVTEETYRNIIINKTAVLISAACEAGAIIARAGQAEREALAGYGMDLGIAFQLIDDLLDYTATSDQFGKPVASDFKEGKITLPLIQALKRCGVEDRERITRLARQETISQEEFTYLLDLIREAKGLEYTWDQAVKSKERAKNHLNAFPASETVHLLADLADFVVERKK